MRKTKLVIILPLCFLFFSMTNCNSSCSRKTPFIRTPSSTNSLKGPEGRFLTKEYIRTLLLNPPVNQEELNMKTYHGCVLIPARGFLQRILVGFEITGENCTATVSENNTVKVSFLGNDVISLVSMSTEQILTDLFIAELNEDQVLIVQHHQGEIVSLTQTIYDKQGNVVYGKSGEGEAVMECIFTMTTSEKKDGKKNCGK